MLMLFSQCHAATVASTRIAETLESELNKGPWARHNKRVSNFQRHPTQTFRQSLSVVLHRFSISYLSLFSILVGDIIVAASLSFSYQLLLTLITRLSCALRLNHKSIQLSQPQCISRPSPASRSLSQAPLRRVPMRTRSTFLLEDTCSRLASLPPLPGSPRLPVL